MDMKSITDRAAQTLLWTELFRGEPCSTALRVPPQSPRCPLG